MKGQLTTEYLISFVIFVGLIAYTYFSYTSNVPRFIEEVRRENIRSKAFQLSELLVNNPGERPTWDYVAECDLNDDKVFNMTDMYVIQCFLDTTLVNHWCVQHTNCNDAFCSNLPNGPGEPFECSPPGYDCPGDIPPPPADCPDICCPQCNLNDIPPSDDVVDMGDIVSCALLFQNNLKRVGLLDNDINKRNLIDKYKVLKLKKTGFYWGYDCTIVNDYNNLKNKVAMDEDFSLIISEIDLTDGSRGLLYSCIPPSPLLGSLNITVQRIVSYNDSGIIKPVEVLIQM